CFHTTNKAGHKLDNFARDGRACVTVATEVEACYEDDFFTTRFASVIARGRVRRMEDGAAMRKVLVALCMKYLPEYKDKIGEGIAREIDDTAIWAVDLEEVRGKGARRLPR
ncbi:pyridoxamine 5'-phosphate oxidase family protein, partial [Gordonibacter pamelaeae]